MLDLNLDIKLPTVDAGLFNFGDVVVGDGRDLSGPRSNMLDFTQYTFPEYQAVWYHKVLCSYLDKWVSGEIKRLMIFTPPRHGKSELVSRRLPAYILGKNPDAEIISASYGSDLAKRMNKDVQRIIDSKEYRNLFPDTTLSGKNAKPDIDGGSWLRNSDMFEVVEYKGTYRGAGVGGAITGMGMHYGIIDDPVKNRQDASSPTISQAIYDWYTSTFRTRQIGDASILLTVTRWDEEDLAGRLLTIAKNDPDADQWTVVKLPAICDGSGSEDDIREEGQALWPDMYSEKSLKATKASISEADWASLYQQSPVVAGGNIYKYDWWDIEAGRNRYSVSDHRMRNQVIGRFMFVDTAMKSGMDNDYSAISVFELLPDYRIRLVDVWREKIDSAFLPDKIEELAYRWNSDERLQTVIIEDKGSGTTSIQSLRRSTAPWLANMIEEFTPAGTKEYRAKQASIWCHRDMALLPYPHESLIWYKDTIDQQDGEIFKFPNAKNDDFTDTFTMALIFLEPYLSQGWHARTESNKL